VFRFIIYPPVGGLIFCIASSVPDRFFPPGVGSGDAQAGKASKNDSPEGCSGSFLPGGVGSLCGKTGIRAAKSGMISAEAKKGIESLRADENDART
jgi:hypothetical protein